MTASAVAGARRSPHDHVADVSVQVQRGESCAECSAVSSEQRVISRRAVIAGLAMAGTSGVGYALVPTRRMSDERNGFHYADAIPKSFAGWTLDERAGALVANPQAQTLLDKLYSEIVERSYVSAAGERVMLSIAYGGDQADVSVQLHYPEICYPAQGFQVLGKQVGQVHLPGGDIPVRRLETVYSRVRYEPVTYWTLIGNEFSLGGWQKRWAQIKHGLQGEIVDGVLVRVSSISRDTKAAFALQDRFIGDLVNAVGPAARRRLVDF